MSDVDFFDRNAANAEGMNSRQMDFIRLYTSSFSWLHSLAYSLVGNSHDADDVMQEVGILLWQRFDQFSPEKSFRNWAAGFTTNVARSVSRKRVRAQGRSLDDDILIDVARVHLASGELLELRRERLETCLSQMAAEHRSLLYEYYEQSASVEQIAEKSQITVQTIYRRLSRLRLALYRCVCSGLKLDGDDNA